MATLYLVSWSSNYSKPCNIRKPFNILCNSKEKANRTASIWKRLCKDEDGDRVDVYLIDTEKKTIVEVKS